MSKHWFEYVKSCYDLVIETEGKTQLILDHEVEAYVVHLMARNFDRTDIGTTAMTFKMFDAIHSRRRDDLVAVADECLLIHSFPLKRHRWPTGTYYQDLGTTAYGMAQHMMESNFVPAGRILGAIFTQKETVIL